ncbi:MAG: chorismate mutase [Candidatus Acetothermia bacterium]
MIEDKRKNINDLDEQILKLINNRVQIAIDIGREKKNRGKEITDQEREREVLNRVSRLNPGPLPEEGAREIFRTIIEATKKKEREVVSK